MPSLRPPLVNDRDAVRRRAFLWRRIRYGLPFVSAGAISMLITDHLEGTPPQSLAVAAIGYAIGIVVIYVPLAYASARSEWRKLQSRDDPDD